MNDPEDRQPAGRQPGPSPEPADPRTAPAPGAPPAGGPAGDVGPDLVPAPSFLPPDAPPIPSPPPVSAPPPLPPPPPLPAPPPQAAPPPPPQAAPPPPPPAAPAPSAPPAAAPAAPAEARWEQIVDPAPVAPPDAGLMPAPQPGAPAWPEPRVARPAPAPPTAAATAPPTTEPQPRPSPPPAASVAVEDDADFDDADFDDADFDDELDEPVSRWAALMATIGTALVGIVSVQVITTLVEGVTLKKGQRVGVADDLFHRLGYPFGGLGATALVFLVLGVVLISLPSVVDEYLSESQDRMVGAALVVAVIMGVIIALGSVLAVRAQLHEYAAKGVAVPAYVRVQFTNFLLGSLGAAALALFGSIAAMNQRDRERTG